MWLTSKYYCFTYQQSSVSPVNITLFNCNPDGTDGSDGSVKGKFAGNPDDTDDTDGSSKRKYTFLYLFNCNTDGACC